MKCVPFNDLSSNDKYYWLPENVNETIVNNFKINYNKPKCIRNESILWNTLYSLNINEISVYLDDVTFENISFCLEKVYFNKTGPTIIAMKYICEKMYLY